MSVSCRSSAGFFLDVDELTPYLFMPEDNLREYTTRSNLFENHGGMHIYVSPAGMVRLLGLAEGLSKSVPAYRQGFEDQEAATNMMGLWGSDATTRDKLYSTQEIYRSCVNKGANMIDSLLVPAKALTIPKGNAYQIALGRLISLLNEKVVVEEGGSDREAVYENRILDYCDLKSIDNSGLTVLDMNAEIKEFGFPIDIYPIEPVEKQLREKRGEKHILFDKKVDANQVDSAEFALLSGLINATGNRDYHFFTNDEDKTLCYNEAVRKFTSELEDVRRLSCPSRGI